jgi:hypothetical protein
MMSPESKQRDFSLLEGWHTDASPYTAGALTPGSHLSVASTQQRCSRAASTHDGVC